MGSSSSSALRTSPSQQSDRRQSNAAPAAVGNNPYTGQQYPNQPQYFQTYNPYYNPQQPVTVIHPLVQMPVPQFHEPYRSPSGMSWTDEKRDLTYCRILAAEEFLARMNETDATIRQFSQLEDREAHLDKISKYLGLRGHLHGELMRIQQMLADDDPDMKCIDYFETSNSAAVQMLRQIRDKRKQLNDATTSTEYNAILEDSSDTADRETKTSVDQNKKQKGTSISTETSTEVCNFGTSTEDTFNHDLKTENHTSSVSTDCDFISEVKSEDELQAMHNEQEKKLSERFAQVIADRRMSAEEVSAVLSKHALNVQALKMKQDAEKERLRNRLNQRLKQIGSNNGDAGSDDEFSFDEEQLKKVKGMTSQTSNTNTTSKSKSSQEKQKLNDLLSKKKQQIKNGKAGDDDDDDVCKLERPLSGRSNGLTRKTKNSDDVTPSLNREQTAGNDERLDEIVRTLELMRMRGELNEDSMAGIMSRYGMKPQPASTSTKVQDKGSVRDRADQLFRENQEKQKQIQAKRMQMKEQIDEKLKQKLLLQNERNKNNSDED